MGVQLSIAAVGILQSVSQSAKLKKVAGFVYFAGSCENCRLSPRHDSFFIEVRPRDDFPKYVTVKSLKNGYKFRPNDKWRLSCVAAYSRSFIIGIYGPVDIVA